MTARPDARRHGFRPGIGAVIARVLHARGVDVVLADVDATRARETAPGIGDRTLAVQTDVRAEEALTAACDAAEERFGGWTRREHRRLTASARWEIEPDEWTACSP